jgi:tetratricopeptide (TPR) repeat protein
MASNAEHFFEDYQERVKELSGHLNIFAKKIGAQENRRMISSSTENIMKSNDSKWRATYHNLCACANVGLGYLGVALTDCEAAIREAPPEEKDFYYDCRGAVYIEKREFDSAIADFDTALRLNSKRNDVLYHRSLAYLGKGDFERAFEDCNKTLELGLKGGRDGLDAYLIRGFLHGKNGDFDKAIMDFEAALQINLDGYYGNKLDIKPYFYDDARKYLEYARQAQAKKEIATKKAIEEAALQALKKSNQSKSSGTIFSIDFLENFKDKLIEFDETCEGFVSETKKNLLDMDKNCEKQREWLKTGYKCRFDVSVSEKSKALKEYKQKLQKLNQTEESRYQTLYAEIIKNKNDGNANEVERLRKELFAKNEIKSEREKLWNEYQNICANISREVNIELENTKDTHDKLTKLATENQKNKEEAQLEMSSKIEEEIKKFKSDKFDPDEIRKEYLEIANSDPFKNFEKPGSKTRSPKSLKIASLTYDLPKSKLGEHSENLLEAYSPEIWHKEIRTLIMPYCIDISKTNGVCFLQTNENKDAIYKTIQSFILRLSLQITPGLLKLTLYDGEGSGKNLIGLSNIDKKIKGENILTDQSELKRALEAAISDMNTTIQKVLGSKYADKTLVDYNEIAGKQAKPYHVICITDFPNGLGKEHWDLISKIVKSGKQAGVFVVVNSIDVSSLLREMSVIEANFLDKDFNLDLNSYFPDTDLLERIQEHIKAEIKKASKVEVDINIGEDKLWQGNSSNGIETPIGQLNVTDLQYFTLSVEDGTSDTPHHCLIGGATGSGKTVLLHNIICNTAWNYSPDEVQFILLDYKEGTEFKVYENLPHAKVLSIHSEREYGISVLEYINAEIERRGKDFKSANAQNIAKYRENTGKKMPRLLIIIDEFQKLLDGDIKTSSYVSASLDDIGRRGRSFGIHLILSSQSLSGVDINQALSHLGLRIALKLNAERDCDYFLGQGNHAPFKSLQKKGEAIYNAKSGLTEGNVRFQVAYLSDKEIGEKISILRKKSAEKYGLDKPFQRFLYDGNVSASIENNKNIPKEYVPDYRKCKVYIGEPIALEEEHTSYSLLRQNESNVLIAGQDILAAMSIFNYSIQQIISQSSEASQVYVCNKVNMDNEYYDKLDSLSEKFSNVKILENDSEIQKNIEAIFDDVEKRKIESNKSRIILAFADIYNARNLRKSGYTDSPLAQKLITILKDGPGLGVHCIVHTSSYENLKNILDVHSMLNEFNVRIELRGGDGYKIFQSNEVGVEKSTPDNWNIANMQTSQMNGIKKIKVYSL